MDVAHRHHHASGHHLSGGHFHAARLCHRQRHFQRVDGQRRQIHGHDLQRSVIPVLALLELDAPDRQLPRTVQLFAVAAGAADSLAADRPDHRCRYQPLPLPVQHPRFRPYRYFKRYQGNEAAGRFLHGYRQIQRLLSETAGNPFHSVLRTSGYR